MKDIDGNEVKVGDIVKVLHIRENIRNILAEDEISHTLAMLNNDYEIDDIVNDNTQISVSYCVAGEEYCLYGGLYLFPHEFRLVERKK